MLALLRLTLFAPGNAPSQKAQALSDGFAHRIPSSSSLSSSGERASRLPKEYGLETLAQQLRSAEATRDRCDPYRLFHIEEEETESLCKTYEKMWLPPALLEFFGARKPRFGPMF